MREAQVAQAALRYGRTPDTNTTIYTMTAAVPDDMPIADENGTVLSPSIGQQEILRAISEAGFRGDPNDTTMTTSDIEDMVSVSRTRVSRFMNTLHEYEYVIKDESGRSNQWEATDRLVKLHMHLANEVWVPQANM